ncbi:hypothetical protein TSHO111613_24725 [Tsukamurella hominis]
MQVGSDGTRLRKTVSMTLGATSRPAAYSRACTTSTSTAALEARDGKSVRGTYMTSEPFSGRVMISNVAAARAALGLGAPTQPVHRTVIGWDGPVLSVRTPARNETGYQQECDRGPT